MRLFNSSLGASFAEMAKRDANLFSIVQALREYGVTHTAGRPKSSVLSSAPQGKGHC